MNVLKDRATVLLGPLFYSGLIWAPMVPRGPALAPAPCNKRTLNHSPLVNFELTSTLLIVRSTSGSLSQIMKSNLREDKYEKFVNYLVA